MPHLVDQTKFETELMRRCEFLVSGAEEEKNRAEKQRVVWLAAEYLRYHGRLLEFPDRPERKPETAPEAITVPSPAMPLPRSTSTQALYNPTPVASPNIDMFSLRLNALIENGRGATATPQPGSGNFYFDLTTPGALSLSTPFGTPLSPTANRTPWASALDCEGLSRDVLLLIDPNTISRSPTVSHLSVLQQLPENLTANFVLGPEGSESHPRSTQQPL
ncbi:hypothetical protein F5051DRAFT_439662 [Lentinula edodes]|nr:hypothetical protein F5051DRAFT_439662 [Lentinula edodes]